MNELDKRAKEEDEDDERWLEAEDSGANDRIQTVALVALVISIGVITTFVFRHDLLALWQSIWAVVPDSSRFYL